MDKLSKRALVNDLRDEFLKGQVLIVTQQTGLNADEVFNLRKIMRKGNTTFRVVKNSLVDLAIDGTDYKELKELLNGPNGFVYGDDILSATKSLHEFMESCPKMKVLGAYGMGKFLHASEVAALAKIPPVDILKAQLLRTLLAPAQKFVVASKDVAQKLVRVIKAFTEK